MEVTFKFPKETKSTVSQMTIQVDDNDPVECEVFEKKQAKQKYDDAIAKGQTATLMQDAHMNPNLYNIDIGNIHPGQSAVVVIKLIQPMDIKGGAFHFNLPMTYFPKNA